MNFHSLARRDLQFLCKRNRIPANLTNVAMAKALEALKTVEGIEEIQEALGIRSAKLNSPELPHIGQKSFTSEPQIKQQQKPSPMPRSQRGIVKMASNKEEIQEKPSPLLHHTAQRTSERRAAHREKPSPLHRSCLKSSIALEEEGGKKKVPQILPKTPATRNAARGVEAQSSRRMVKKNEDVECHTKTPKEVEAKGQKAIAVDTRRSTRLSSRKALEESVATQFKSKSSSRKNSAVKIEAFAKEDAGEGEKEQLKKVEVENECESQQEMGRLHPLSNRMNTKALEATKMVPKEEDDKKVTIVDLIEEKAGVQEKEEDERELAEKSDSCTVALVEANTEEDKKKESHGYSSSSEVKKDDSIAPLVEEAEKNNQEVENLCFSSSTQVEDSNIEEVENGDSTVALVEGDEKNVEKLEIQVSSFSIEMKDSNVETESYAFNVVHVEEEGRKDQEESHELSSFRIENSIEHCNDQSPENDLVDNSSDIVPTNEAVKYSVDNSSEAKLASSALSDNSFCIEVTPFSHEEAIQPSSGIEEVDAITNPTDEVSTTEASKEIPGEVMESGGILTSEVSVAIRETIDDGLSNTGAHGAIDSVDAQSTSSESQILVSSIKLCTEISAADSTIEWQDKNANELPVIIKESFEESITDSSELTANGFVDVQQKGETLKDNFFELQIPVSSAEICSDFLTVDSTIESRRVDHLSENFRESVEDDYLHKLVANESFKVLQKTENDQSGSFKVQNPVSCTEPCFELSTTDSNIDFKEAFGNLSSEISASIDESIAAGLQKSDKISPEISIDAETSHAASSEPQIPVPSPAELSTSSETIFSPLKLPCALQTKSLLEPSIVQTQSFEQAPIVTTEMAEEKEETMIKASEKEVFLKGVNLELMSLRKLRAMYKQMVNGPKTDEKKRSMMIKQQDLECLSRNKLDSNYKQKLNDDITKSEKKRSVIKQQQDLECLSRSKLDSNNKQKLNDEFIKSERKIRTPLKNLNYKIEF